MADFNKSIDRSQSFIDPALFKKLVRLMMDLPWLEPSSEELAMLWNLCDTSSEEQLIEQLLKRFMHVDSAHLRKLGEKCAAEVYDEWGLRPNDTLIVATSDSSKADGSQMFIQNMKNKFTGYGGWTEANFCNRIGDSVPRLGKIVNIVLVDDFIGTGNTMSRRVKWYQGKVDKKGLTDKVRLFVISIAAMEISCTVLDELGIDYFCTIWLKKGISDFYKDNELTDAISDMNKLEYKLEPEVAGRKLQNFGWGRSEALFALESFNVPNNVFPVFWWPELKPGKKRKTIFMRLE